MLNLGEDGFPGNLNPASFCKIPTQDFSLLVFEDEERKMRVRR